jgi:Ca2+-binding EF-hand superfamily protein
MRRFNFLPILLLALGLAAPAAAQRDRWNDDDWWDDERWGPAGWTSDFDRLDRNDNGYISRNEWTGAERVFERVDRNEDGRLSRTEVRRWDEQREERLEERFYESDRNRDRRLSEREWWGNDLAFERLDVNGDDYLSWREVRDRDVYGNRAEDRQFRQLDRNDDGRLTKAEFRGSRREFDRLDRNDDGWITAVEWRRS